MPEPASTDPALSQADRRTGACAYLLHGLLQRLELERPGLLEGLIDGVASDRAAMAAQDTQGARIGCEIADEALGMLRLMQAQLQMQPGA